MVTMVSTKEQHDDNGAAPGTTISPGMAAPDGHHQAHQVAGTRKLSRAG